MTAVVALLAVGCASLHTPNRSSELPVRYHNARYRLTFFLPATWQGYSVVLQQWHGYPGEVEHGPVIVFRHPQWRTNDLYQGIPIMVFTRQQWDDEEAGKFFPSAGGILYELWHNQQYVFALHSRYNAFDEVKGSKEAADIIESNCATHSMQPLHPRS